MSDHIPEDVMILILARLPVKSLLKFRCVSKSWYSLIGSPDFMKTHLSLINDTKNNKFLFFKNNYHTAVKPVGFFSLNHKDTLDEYSRFEYSLTSDYKFTIVGSCNGLLCLLGFINTIIVLWNPSIKKYVTLPTPNITHLMDGKTTRFLVVGLGFDHRANDYKVVRVAARQDGSKIYPAKVELFELSKGSWRGISCNAPPYFISGNYLDYYSYAYINGVVHWIALDKSDVNGFHSLIVAFDMVDEVFREMALPDCIADGFMLQLGGVVRNISIGIFEESLVVCHLNLLPLSNPCSCSIWFMKEYGVAKSWVNQYNVDLGGGLKTVRSGMKMKNGELLLGITTGRLVLCNPTDQQMKDVEFYGPSIHSYYVDTYMESLVLLKGRQTDSCNVVTSKTKEDETEEQQCPTILRGSKDD